MSHALRAGPSVESQADVAYREIRQLVLRSRDVPDVVWFERQLGEQLGMGRTPVREALKRLQNEGLLIPVSAHGGLVPARISTEDVEHVYRLRGVLEALSAELAALRSEKGELSRAQLAELKDRAHAVKACTNAGDTTGASEANSRFHEYISALAANPYLEDALNRLWSRISVSALSNLVDDEAWISEMHGNHDELVRCIAEGRALDASQIASQHIRRAAEVYTQHHLVQEKESVR